MCRILRDVIDYLAQPCLIRAIFVKNKTKQKKIEDARNTGEPVFIIIIIISVYWRKKYLPYFSIPTGRNFWPNLFQISLFSKEESKFIYRGFRKFKIDWLSFLKYIYQKKIIQKHFLKTVKRN